MMVGQSISHYKLVSQLGEGGMGVVYKAEDTKLNRQVALKFLAQHLLDDEEAKERFLREAQAAAALHHPNICPVHEIDEVDGKTFISMAFLEGDTLEDRIAEGPLSIKDALDIARQVADGLDAAHEKGVFHRDIKPANIMVDAKGRATIMDFGLARLTEASRLTKVDTAMGTVAYMSPEQAQGMEVDGRTDLWSLGCVLYEMVSGQRPFQGQYDQALLYEICHEEPAALTGLRTGVPVELELLASKCLAKDRDDRYQYAKEIAVDLRTLAEKLKSGRSTILRTTNLTAGVPATMTAAHTVMWWAVAAVALIAVAVLGILVVAPSAGVVERVSRSVILLDEDVRLAALVDPTSGLRAFNLPLALTPDGSVLFFVGERNGGRAIYRRPMDGLAAEAIPGTEGAEFVFVSPDGMRLGFVAERQLKHMPADGGVPVTFHEGRVEGAAWGPADMVAFVEDRNLWLIDTNGGQPELITGGSVYRGQPFFLPGGREVLLSDWIRGMVVRVPLSTGETEDLTRGMAAQFISTGHILFRRDESLWAMPFDSVRGETTGGAVQVLPEAIGTSMVLPNYAVSAEGTLVYLPATSTEPVQQLVWVNRDGSEEALALAPGRYRIPRLSSDQSRIVFDDCCQSLQPPTGGLWMYDLRTETITRLTFDATGEFHPLWTPDGERVAFYTYGRSIDLREATGGGEVGRVVEGVNPVPQAFSADGESLVYFHQGDIHVVPLDGSGESDPLIASPAVESGGYLSPDGRWIAYSSDESGRPEIYVRPFPNVADGRWQLSTDGGTEASWALDRRELFFRNGDWMMAVEVDTSTTFAHGAPQALFQGRYDTHQLRNYDVARDGLFLMVKDASPVDRVSERQQLVLVQNWFGELKRLVPTN